MRDNPLSSFRSSSRASSSAGFVTNLPRARSLSVATSSSSHRHHQTDSRDHLSKIRDHDLKANIEAKVDRLSRKLQPENGQGEHSYRSQTRRSAAQSNWPPSSGASEDLQTTGFVSGESWREKYGPVVRRTEPPYHLEKLVQTSAAVQQRALSLLLKDLADRDNLQSSSRHVDRFSSILDELRRHQPVTHSVETDVNVNPDNGRRLVRAELDEFARMISQLAYGRRGTRATGSSADDFWTRLAHTRGDLTNLETLVSRTFGSTLRTSSSPPADYSGEPVFIFHDRRPGEKNFAAFVTSGDVDYRQTDAAADMAIRWAQDRRAKIEDELHHARSHETPRPRSLQARVDTSYDDGDDYYVPDVPTIVRPSQSHYHRSATVDIHGGRTEPVTSRDSHRYTRSATSSVSHPTSQPKREDKERSQNWHPNYSTVYVPRPPMSEARQRARSVLAKHGRRRHTRD